MGKVFNWSDEQTDIIELAKISNEHIMVEATAGSGKTTVVVEGVAPWLPDGSVMTAFSKKVAVELESRLPSRIKSQTYNAFWLAFLKQRLSRSMKIDGWKVKKIVEGRLKKYAEASWEIMELVGLAKNNAIGILTDLKEESQWRELIDMHDIGHDDFTDEQLIKGSIRALELSNKDYSVIDFDDMMYMSLKLILERGWKVDTAPVVVVDEIQDLNILQEELLSYMGERIIGIGDSEQAIYGFRGAGINTIPRITERFGMKLMPMNTSRRVPRSGCEYARRFSEKIEAATDASEGSVSSMLFETMATGLGHGCMVLCRNNAPLFKVALRLLRDSVSFEMSGKMPDKLISWVKRFKATSTPDLKAKIANWWATESRRLKSENKMRTYTREEDKVETSILLCDRFNTVDDLVKALEQIKESRGGVKLSTVHGAKGLESIDVFWLYPQLHKPDEMLQEWERQQEVNLQFVAATRHKNSLYLITE